VIELGLAVALGTLGVGVAAMLLLRMLPTVRLQLVGLAFLCVVLPLAAVLLSGWVMFHMGDDVKILAVAAASASAAVGAATSTSSAFRRVASKPSASNTNARPPVIPAAKLRPTVPRTTTVPFVMYSQPWSPTSSTTATAPELRTANRSPAAPAQKSSPPVAP
jgi:hypothetical protein